MSTIWEWPEGAKEAVEKELEGLGLDLQIDDEEEQADAISDVAGVVMRRLAPFVTRLAQKYDREAYARGLRKAREELLGEFDGLVDSLAEEALHDVKVQAIRTWLQIKLAELREGK